MNPSELLNKAFQNIQENKELYQQWCSARSETERTLLLLQQAYTIGVADGMMERIRPV